MKNKIILYGAQWCADCRVSKKFLEDNEIEYEYVDLELVPEAADIVEKLNGGFQTIPTILFPDGTVLVEPSNEELFRKLRSL